MLVGGQCPNLPPLKSDNNYTIGTSLLETRQGRKAIETTMPTTATTLADWLVSYTGTGQIIVLGDDDNTILSDTEIS